MSEKCRICSHHCELSEGQWGLCRARENRDGKIVCRNYGKLAALHLDPIEKKPLKRFYSGRSILSIGSFGCNMRCAFCQNYHISMSDGTGLNMREATPEELVRLAISLQKDGNIGIAYTYNEPFIGFEFVYDTAKLAWEKGLKNVVVTNGNICQEPLLEILPFIDAMNIDLKSFSQNFYVEAGGDLETVKNTIRLASESCHVEVTTLIIPGENDSEEEMEAMSSWLAEIDYALPLHITRFFPKWKMRDGIMTPIETIYKLSNIAGKHLKYVYQGNI